jgi:hypothetical protein
VVDAGPLPPPPGPHRAYLPLVMGGPPCDPVVYPLRAQSVERSVTP